MVTHVFYYCNLSQEIFAIDTWRAVTFGTWSQTHVCDPSDYMESRLYIRRTSDTVKICLLVMSVSKLLFVNNTGCHKKFT